MATAEEKWIRRLRRCIKDMPETLEVVVHNSHLSVCERGERDRYFEEHGHTDNPEEIEMIITENVFPNGESM